MKLNSGVASHSNILNEIDRANLVGKTKSQSPQRYTKRLGYRPKQYNGININDLLKDDILALRVPVGDYTCVIAYQGVLDKLKDVLSAQPSPNVTLQSVIRALTRSIDNTDILVDCSCADFKYRFAYWATKYGYKYGKPETRPTKITNPNDKQGAMCKHLTSLLSNKKWLVRAATILNNYIKAYPEDVMKAMGLSEDEFIINKPGRPKRSFSNTPSSSDKNKFKNTKDSDENSDTDEESDEELEVNDEELDF